LGKDEKIIMSNSNKIIECPVCRGTGKIIGNKKPQGEPEIHECMACYGEGKVIEANTKKQTIKLYKYYGSFGIGD